MSAPELDHDRILLGDFESDARMVVERILPHLTPELRSLTRDVCIAGGSLTLAVEYTRAALSLKLVLSGPDGSVTLWKA